MHVFDLMTPRPYRVIVRPSRPVRILLTGIPDGSYPVEVDHVTRGRLIVGAAPGP